MSSEKDTIVFAGGIFRDLVTVTPRFPKPGETLFGTNFFTGFGGKTANQSVMCRLLGEVNVSLLGKLGDDDNGRAYLSHLGDVGISTDFIEVVPDKPTGVAAIYVNSSSGENQIVVVAGANEKMCYEDVDRLSTDRLFERARAVVCALEMPLEAVTAAFKKAKHYGAKTVLNAAPARVGLDPELLRNTDILCVNESEAEIMSGLTVGCVEEAKVACRELQKKVPTVVITLGASGAVVGTKQDSVHIALAAASEVKVVDTTGAGDAFVGALVFFKYFLERPLEWPELVRRACVVATDSVQRAGTQSSYSRRSDLPKELFQ